MRGSETGTGFPDSHLAYLKVSYKANEPAVIYAHFRYPTVRGDIWQGLPEIVYGFGKEARREEGVAEPLGCGLNAARLIFLGALPTSPPQGSW